MRFNHETGKFIVKSTENVVRAARVLYPKLHEQCHQMTLKLEETVPLPAAANRLRLFLRVPPYVGNVGEPSKTPLEVQLHQEIHEGAELVLQKLLMTTIEKPGQYPVTPSVMMNFMINRFSVKDEAIKREAHSTAAASRMKHEPSIKKEEQLPHSTECFPPPQPGQKKGWGENIRGGNNNKACKGKRKETSKSEKGAPAKKGGKTNGTVR